MYRIIDSRSSGKTSRLMLLAKENNSVIACSNPYAMREKALGYGITGLTIVSYEDILNKDNDYLRGRTVMIDEIESFVQHQLFTKLTGYTLSNED